MRKLMISHATADSQYVEAFVELLEDLRLPEDRIICSSVPPYCIPLNNNVYDWLINEYQTRDLHVVFMLSDNYYKSAACLNEMGAAWALKKEWTGILLPGFGFGQVCGCVDAAQIGIKLDDADLVTLRYRLGELKSLIIKEFGLPGISDALWERKRDRFMSLVGSVTK